jgi:hypothetical protein
LVEEAEVVWQTHRVEAEVVVLFQLVALEVCGEEQEVVLQEV